MSAASKLVRILSELPLFKGLAVEHLKMVFKICQPKQLGKDIILCSEGQLSNTIFILMKGKIKTQVMKNTVAVIDKVCSLGEIGCFLGQKRNATLTLMEDSDLIFVEYEKLSELMERNHTLRQQVNHNFAMMISSKIEQNNAAHTEFNKGNEQLSYLAKLAKSIFSSPKAEITEAAELKEIPEGSFFQGDLFFMGSSGVFSIKAISPTTILVDDDEEMNDSEDEIEGIMYFHNYRPVSFKANKLSRLDGLLEVSLASVEKIFSSIYTSIHSD